MSTGNRTKDLDIDRNAEAHGFATAQSKPDGQTVVFSSPSVTAEDVDEFVRNFNDQMHLIVASVKEGLFDPLRVYASINGIKKSIEDVKPELEKHAMEEADKFGKSFSKAGVEFSIRNGSQTLDYEADEVYKERKESLKAREEMLKMAFKSKETFFDGEGVEVPKVPVKSFTKDSLVVKFKK